MCSHRFLCFKVLHRIGLETHLQRVRSYFTLTTPRKTFCVAVMSSSLFSVNLGWMLSFWAASSTCCPDTVTDSNKDDISMCNTSSSVPLTCLKAKSLVLISSTLYTPVLLTLSRINIRMRFIQTCCIAAPHYVPGSHCC